MKKDDLRIEFLPPLHYGSKLSATPTVRDVLQSHDEVSDWIKKKEKKPDPQHGMAVIGKILLILAGAPLLTYLEYLLIKSLGF